MRSEIATPVSAVEGHTVFCTPNTDDWTGGVARPQPPDLEFFSAYRLSPDPDNLNTPFKEL